MMRAMVKAETKPVWTSSSFLIYAGGLTVLLGAGAGLAYLSSVYSAAATAGWAFLYLVIVYGLANVLYMRDRWIPAGILAFVSVILWAVFLVFLFDWFGWKGVSGNLGTWSWSRMLFWILVLASAWFDRMRFRFPFIRLISAVIFWLFIADLLTSGSGNWFATVTLLVGLLYLLVGHVVDKPSAFWLHLVGGVLIGGALLKWFHTSDTDFAIISIASLLYVLVSYWTKRSSWAFLGTIGFFAATIHYLIGSPTQLVQGIFGVSQQCGGTVVPQVCTSFGPQISPWSPALAFGLLGFWLMLLGMLGKRNRGHKAGAVVVEKTTVVVEPAAE